MITQEQPGRETEQAHKGMEAQKVWSSFVRMLQNDQISAIHIRPYHPALLESLFTFLRNLSKNTD